MTQLHTLAHTPPGWQSFLNMLNFSLFAESDSTCQTVFFSTRGINRSHLCRGRAYTPSVPHKILYNYSWSWAEASHEGLRTGTPHSSPHSWARTADNSGSWERVYPPQLLRTGTQGVLTHNVIKDIPRFAILHYDGIHWIPDQIAYAWNIQGLPRTWKTQVG